MTKPQRQKMKWWRPSEDYDYDEEWNDMREERWERLMRGIP